MSVDPAVVEFLTSTATGAGAVLLIILFAAIGIPKRSPAATRQRRR
jgi:hypothetical protein